MADYSSKEREKLLNRLAEMPIEILRLSVVYALGYREYGEDLTKKWQTAIQQTAVLEKAYLKGRKDMYEEMRGADNG